MHYIYHLIHITVMWAVYRTLNNIRYGRQKEGDKTALSHWRFRLRSAKGGAFQSFHKNKHILHSETLALTNVER